MPQVAHGRHGRPTLAFAGFAIEFGQSGISLSKVGLTLIRCNFCRFITEGLLP